MLVSARRFPGIDQTKLDALTAPAVIDRSARHLTSPEMLDGLADRSELEVDDAGAADPSGDGGRLTADLGGVRQRIAAHED